MICIWSVAIRIRLHPLGWWVGLETFILLSHISQEVFAQFFRPLNFLRIWSGDMEIRGFV
jgi:hypothetical protein